MIRPPPRSTLFPSPPLFRSLESAEACRPAQHHGGRLIECRPHHRVADPGDPAGHVGLARYFFGVNPKCAPTAFDPAKRVGSSTDRKSTRLNSSHANISYAVF